MVSSDSSSDDDESSEEEEIDDVEEEEEEIEEISTEGARANGLVLSSNRGQEGVPGAAAAAVASGNPLSLKTEMNKVDVIVDGRPVAGMYQVVHHRIETISTTNAVVPRAVIDVEQQVRDYFSSKSEMIKIAV